MNRQEQDHPPAPSLESDCPEPAELIAFAAGRLPDSNLQRLAGHLSQCASCERQFTQICSNQDSLVAQLRDMTTVEDLTLRPGLKQMQNFAQALSLPGGNETGQSGASPPEASSNDLESVPQHLGRYELMDLVGAGGMGTVYRARHLDLRRIVALKVLPYVRSQDPAHVARFQREMKVNGVLDHPNIVRVSDAGQLAGHHFIVMDFIEGASLAEAVNLLGELSVADTCELVRQAAEGLEYLASHQLVHRDIKPSNLMLRCDGIVQILDFGLSRHQWVPTDVTELTGNADFLGTIDFVAPEQIDRVRAVDSRTDLYSLGCTWFKLLTGQAPFSGDDYPTPAARLFAHREDRPPLEKLKDGAPPAVVATIERLLAKDPRDRFPSPAALIQEITPWCRDAHLVKLAQQLTAAKSSSQKRLQRPVPALRQFAPASTDSPPKSHSPRRPAWRQRTGVALACLAIAAAVGLALFSFLSLPKDESATPTIWEATFGYPPQRLNWPRQSNGTLWSIDPQSDALFVSCHHPCLIQLASLSQRDIELAIDIQRVGEADYLDVGFFLGFHTRYQGQRKSAWFQLLRIVTEKMPNGQRATWLIRSRSRMGSDGSIESPIEYKEAIQWPSGELACRLHLTLTEQGLAQILWAGQPLESLVTPDINQQFQQADYLGPFGIFNRQSTHRFAAPKFQPLTSESS